MQATIHLFFKSCKNDKRSRKRKLITTEKDIINVTKSNKIVQNKNYQHIHESERCKKERTHIENENNNEKTAKFTRDIFKKKLFKTDNNKLSKNDTVNIVTCKLAESKSCVKNKFLFQDDSTNITGHRSILTKYTTNIDKVSSSTNQTSPNLSQFIVDLPIVNFFNNIYSKRKILLQLIEKYQNSIQKFNFLSEDTNSSSILFSYISRYNSKEARSSVKCIKSSNDVLIPSAQQHEIQDEKDDSIYKRIDNYKISDLRAIIETNDGFITCFTYCDSPNRFDTNILTNKHSVKNKVAFNEKYEPRKDEKHVFNNVQNTESKLDEIFKSFMKGNDGFCIEEKYTCKQTDNETHTELTYQAEIKDTGECKIKETQHVTYKQNDSEIFHHFKNIKKSLHKPKKIDCLIKNKKKVPKQISTNAFKCVKNVMITRSKVNKCLEDGKKICNVKKLQRLSKNIIIDRKKSEKPKDTPARFWTLRNRLSTRLSKKNCELLIKNMVMTRSALKKFSDRPKNKKPKGIRNDTKKTKKKIKQKENICKQKGNVYCKKKQNKDIKKTNRSHRPINVRGPQIISGLIAENLVQPCRKFPLITNLGNRIASKTVENQKHKILKPYLPPPKPKPPIKKYTDDLADYAHLLPGASDLRNNNFTQPYSLIERLFLKLSPLASMR